jgi:hypothetical protein
MNYVNRKGDILKQDDLMKAFDLFKIQGFQTLEEMFVLGFLMAHGGEKYVQEITTLNLELLAGNPQFWLPHIRDEHNIHITVCDEEISAAESILRTFLDTRNARIPEWLQKKP